MFSYSVRWTTRRRHADQDACVRDTRLSPASPGSRWRSIYTLIFKQDLPDEPALALPVQMALGLLAASGGLLYYYMNTDKRDRNLGAATCLRKDALLRRLPVSRQMPLTLAASCFSATQAEESLLATTARLSSQPEALLALVAHHSLSSHARRAERALEMYS